MAKAPVDPQTWAGTPTNPDDRWHEPEDLTCYECDLRETCPFVDDWYNTDGDCLYLK